MFFLAYAYDNMDYAKNKIYRPLSDAIEPVIFARMQIRHHRLGIELSPNCPDPSGLIGLHPPLPSLLVRISMFLTMKRRPTAAVALFCKTPGRVSKVSSLYLILHVCIQKFWNRKIKQSINWKMVMVMVTVTMVVMDVGLIYLMMHHFLSSWNMYTHLVYNVQYSR